MLDQIWLIIVIAGLASGFAVLASLSILGKIFSGPDKPIRMLLIALGAMGLFALAGVYLRILDIPRHGIIYGTARSVVWFFFLFRFANYAFYPLRKFFWLVAFLVSLLLLIVDHSTTSLSSIITFSFSSLLASVMIFVSGKKVLREGAQVVHLPLRRLHRVFGWALIICTPAYFLDILVSRLMFWKTGGAPDGLIFALGYLVTNSVILQTLFFSLKEPRGTEAIAHTLPKTLVLVYSLIPREIKVAEAVLKGMSDKEIARELYISHRTVDTHLRNLYRKCGIRSRTSLFRLVADYGKSPD